MDSKNSAPRNDRKHLSDVESILPEKIDSENVIQLTGVPKRGESDRKRLNEISKNQIVEACSSFDIAIKIGPKSSKIKSRSKPMEKKSGDQSKKYLVIDCVESERAQKKLTIQTQLDSQLLNISSKSDCLFERSELLASENSSPRNDRQNFRDSKSPVKTDSIRLKISQSSRPTRSADQSKLPELCKPIEEESMFQVELFSDPAVVSIAKIDSEKLSTLGNDKILTQITSDESKKYSLRSLIKRSEKPAQRTEVICEKTAIKQKVITPIQRAGIHWATLVNNNYEISVGSIVLAKMNTFWPWPAQIIRFNKSKAHIRFFGDLTTGSVSKKNCVPYQKCALVINFYLEAIPVHLRLEYMKLLHKEYNVDARSNYTRNMDLRAKFMQAVDDIGLYLELGESVLEQYLKKLHKI